MENNFNQLVERYRDLLSDFKSDQARFAGHVHLSYSTIKREIGNFRDYLEKFTILYEEMLKEKLLDDPTGQRGKYLEAVMASINKIQFIYLLNLSQRESHILNRWNFGLAGFSIIFGFLTTIASIWYSKVDSQPGQDELFRKLAKQEKQIKQLLKRDSLIMEQVSQKPVQRSAEVKLKH